MTEKIIISVILLFSIVLLCFVKFLRCTFVQVSNYFLTIHEKLEVKLFSIFLNKSNSKLEFLMFLC